MLKDKIAAAARRPVLAKVLGFFDGRMWPFVYAAAALVSSLTGLELPFFALTALTVVFLCLFAGDARPLFPVAVLAWFSRSWRHSSRRPYGSDYFGQTYVIVFLAVCGAVALAALLWRLIVYRQGSILRDKAAYKGSMLALAFAFLCNGAFFGGWEARDLLFGGLYCLTYFGLYLFFYHTMRPREDTPVYVAFTLFAGLCLIGLQLGKMLLFDGVIADGSIDKDLMNTGWAVNNGVGSRIAAFLPACFYLSMKVRRGFVFYLCGFLFYGTIALTLCRGALLFGGVAVLCMAVYLSIAPSPVRRFARIANLVLLALAAAAAVLLREKIEQVFALLFERGFGDTGRFFLWKNGWRNFLRAPVFGVGFCEPIAPGWYINGEPGAYPDMYHNIAVQILASCGVVVVAALAYHFVQLAAVALRRGCTAERLFFLSVIGVILLISLVDVQMFLPATGMLYSCFLLFAEREGSPPAGGGEEEKREKAEGSP